MKRTVTLFLVLLILVSVFSSCADEENKSSQETTVQTAAEISEAEETNNYDDAGFIKDNLPSDLSFGVKDITILYWSDYTMTEFFTEAINGEIINDAIYSRNEAVEERLGVKLSYVGQKGYESTAASYIQAAENDIQSGQCDYDIYASYSKTVAAMSLKGDMADLMNIDYLDFEMPWWPKSLIDECTINNILYFCSGDISTNMLWMMIGTFFNTDLIESYGLDNPYDLVDSNEWTMDKLIEMTGNIYVDLNNDNRHDDGDMFGFIIYNDNIDAFFTSAGLMSIEKDKDGSLVISPSFHGETMINLISKIGNYFMNNPGAMYSSNLHIRDNFFNQNAVLTMDRVFIVAGKDNRDYNTKIEFTYGIVPNAKWSTTDNYYTNLGHPFTMYAVSKGINDSDMAGAVLECLASESYRQVTPAVFETAMKIKYAHDEKASQMYDLIRGTVVFDLGRLYASNFSDYTSSFFRQQVISNSSTFASKYKSIEKTIQAGIEKLINAYS